MSNDYRAYVECDYNSIYHHGIKGMKWGVRRFQNEDGSLTPEGQKRYGEYFLLSAKQSAARELGDKNLENLYERASSKAYNKLVRRGFRDPEMYNMYADYFLKYRKDNNIKLHSKHSGGRPKKIDSSEAYDKLVRREKLHGKRTGGRTTKKSSK